MESPENTIRQEAKRLGISNWHNKKIAGLKKEVLEAKAMDNPQSPNASDPVDTDNPTEEVKKMKTNQFEKSVKQKEKEGNKGFVEAAKEESLYPFPNPKGDRIGLWRKINTEVYIPPYKKDSSFEFVKWSDEQ